MSQNFTDVTDMTDRVFDIFLRVKGGEDGIVTEHLTTTERAQLARAMGWAPSPAVTLWTVNTPVAPTEDDTRDYGARSARAFARDYEGIILDREDSVVGDYL